MYTIELTVKREYTGTNQNDASKYENAEDILLHNGGVLQAGINFEETWLYEGVSNDIIINLRKQLQL